MLASHSLKGYNAVFTAKNRMAALLYRRARSVSFDPTTASPLSSFSSSWISAVTRCQSSGSSSTTTTSASEAVSNGKITPDKLKTKEERIEFLQQANTEMEKYHLARMQLAKGELVNKNPFRKTSREGYAQMALVGVFVVLFCFTPFVGRKIARDEEFKANYIPSWYDYTIKKPENPYTREEITRQILSIQQEMHERAKAGEFAPEKLKQLEQRIAMADQAVQSSSSSSKGKEDSDTDDVTKRQAMWDRIHPGLEEGEEVSE